MVTSLVVFFLIFWLIYIIEKTFFWIWLWQLKEYRLDRMRAHFELKSSRKIFLNWFYISKLSVFILFALYFANEWLFPVPGAYGLFRGLMVAFMFVIYFPIYIFLGTHSLLKLFHKEWKLPSSTKKTLIITALFLAYISATILLLFSPLFVDPSVGMGVTKIMLVFASDIFIAVIISIIVAVIKFPSIFLKNQILNRAKQKVESLNDLLVIGITGSYGKTSVKEILARILSKKFNVLKTQANQNTEIGVAKAALEKLKPEHQIFIVEMAAYKMGEIRTICDMVRPQIGILTAIGTQHLSLFGSQENIVRGKYELIEALPKDGLAIFNGDNEYCRELYEKTAKQKVIYTVANLCESTSANLREFTTNFANSANVSTCDIKVLKDGLEFIVVVGNEQQKFVSRLVGGQNVSNILAAVSAAKTMGMPLEEISQAVAEIEPFAHTLEIRQGINNSVLMDDSYSANFEGVMAALDYLSLYKDSKKLMIFYPMIELGNMAKELHRKIGEKIGKVCDLSVLTSPDFSKEIIEGALSAGMSSVNIFVCQQPPLVIEKVKNFVKEKDVILVENRVSKEILSDLIVIDNK